jgi:hydrogenase nickel incorporation protein HypA/HybF
MHEMGIANSILDAVQREASLRPGMRVAKVVVRLGAFAGVDTESLRFCFDALVLDTALAPLELGIEGTKDDALDLAYLEMEELCNK